MASRSCCRRSIGSRCCARARPRALASSLWSRRHSAQLHPAFHLAMVPWVARVPRRLPCGSVSSRTWCSCCTVHGGGGISPSASHRRTTGADTLHTAAAWRIDVTGCSLTNGTLVRRHPGRCRRLWRGPFQQNRRHVLIRYGSQRR
jgi:hypothetical protein